MLVLTRKADEAILVGAAIRIRVLKIDGNRVRLGIEAPNDLLIVREETNNQKERDCND